MSCVDAGGHTARTVQKCEYVDMGGEGLLPQSGGGDGDIGALKRIM